MAPEIFGAFDHSRTEKKSQSQARRSIRSNVKCAVLNIQDDRANKVKSRGMAKQCIRFTRKAIGYLLTIAIVVSSFIIVTYCVTNTKAVEASVRKAP